MRVHFGVDRFLTQASARRRTRFALVTNHAACTGGYIASRQALVAEGFRIVKLLSPEHGLDAIGADGRQMGDGLDPLTLLPVRSLYGERLEPDGEDLAEVEAVLLDLPDTGCRCYTYLWTLSKVMEACARWSKPLIVLDRPNPISGILRLAEGPELDEACCSSFIGRWNIPLRHSCTFGELASLWQSTRVRSLELEVIPAEGWRRSQFYPELATSFVPTSPAIASFEACLLYPGLCLLEATNLSEGRGTPLPFRVAGAPWMGAIGIAEAYNRCAIDGVVARQMTFTPQTGKYCGETCHAIMLHVTDVRVFRPVWSAMMLLRLIREAHPDHFAWAGYVTHVNQDGGGHLDKLLGVRDAELLFDLPRDGFVNSVRALLEVSDWSETMAPHLLYED